MYCQSCGASNSDDAKFCNQCGGRIARPGDVGGPAGPGATAVGLGAGSSAAPVAPPSSAPVATGSAAAPVNVWEQQQTSGSGGGPSMMSVSLETIGVRSTKKVWAGIAIVALLLVALGALGSWLLRPEPEVVAEAGHAQPEDPFVIGTPLPPGEAVVPPTPTEEPADDATAMTSTMTTTMRSTSTMSGSGTGGTSATSSGTSGSSTSGSTMTGSTSDSTSMTGTTMETDTTSMETTTSMGTGGTSGTNGSGDGNGTAGGSSGGGTSGGTTGGDTTGGGTGTAGGGTVPNLGGDGPEERDLELELYGSRVRFVVQRYYAARAQTCFDRATRNNPSVSGTVVVNMTIGADGNVSNTSIARNTTGDEVLGNCLRSQVASWQLPPPPGGSLDMQMPFSR